MHHQRYQTLHAIAMLRELLRRWWGAALTLADQDGAVLDWSGGAREPTLSEACQQSLASAEGARCCGAAVRVLHEQLKASPGHQQSQSHTCRLGFAVMGAPISVGGAYRGMLFLEGLSRQPVLGEAALAQLGDLLELGAREISAFEAGQAPRPRGPLEAPSRFEHLIGTSAPMQALFRILERVCSSDSTVLVNGESGTGKELVARAIHHHGPRKDRPFVVQNCSAFTDDLLESALFGHVKGSFTGATRDKEGLFETAHLGTFFLDEVGDMSPALQVKLLRVLQEGTFLPVGGTTPKQVDVRVIAATHKDLLQLVERGEFREDLYYRINVLRLRLPALRERKEDLPVLVDHFLRKHRRQGQRARSLAPETLRMLQTYHWPGNIRELENEVERLLVLGGDQETLGPDLLSSRIVDSAAGTGAAKGPLASRQVVSVPGRLNEAVEQLEREMIAAGLARTGGNKSRLSRELGISRSNLILKIQKYGLERGAAQRTEGDA